MVDVNPEKLDAPKTNPATSPLPSRGKIIPAQNESSPDFDAVRPSFLLPPFNTPRKDRLRPTPASVVPARESPNLLWGILGFVFLALILVVPFVQAWLGDLHSMRYLLRLGSTAVLLLIVGGIVGLSYLISRR
jgi:hypothetical protein